MIVVFPKDIDGPLLVDDQVAKLLNLGKDQIVSASIHTQILAANLIECQRRMTSHEVNFDNIWLKK